MNGLYWAIMGLLLSVNGEIIGVINWLKRGYYGVLWGYKDAIKGL